MAQLGAVAIVLVIVFVVGTVWFHIAEAILTKAKRWLFKSKKPTVWHTLPSKPEQEDNKDVIH